MTIKIKICFEIDYLVLRAEGTRHTGVTNIIENTYIMNILCSSYLWKKFRRKEQFDGEHVFITPYRVEAINHESLFQHK